MEITYDIVYHEFVVRDDIPRLGDAEKNLIKQTVEQKLSTHPEAFGSPLRYSLKGLRKLRVGSYRVVFRIEKNIVKIFAILPRDVVYKMIQKRV